MRCNTHEKCPIDDDKSYVYPPETELSVCLTLKGRDETSEGLDRKLALNYYARWKFTNDLMPLLRKAKDAGEDAKMLSVLSAGHGGPIDLDDLGLKKGFSLYAAGVAAVTYNDLMIEVCLAFPEIRADD